jgi:hypothetical protein
MHTRGDDDFHSPNLAVSGEDAGKQECARVVVFRSFFFLWLCVLLLVEV